MKFDLTKACGDCPFRNSDKAIRLHRLRARDIGQMMESRDGGTFACHKTVKHSDADTEDDFHIPSRNEQHCAGALVYAMKQDNFTQMMRIAERTGWDPSKMEGFDEIIDDWEEMETSPRG